MTAPESPTSPTGAPFLTIGDLAQQRYETVRSYMLLPSSDRPQTSVARFLLARVERFGMLGLHDHDPEGAAWGMVTTDRFQVEVIPVGTADAHGRAARMYEFLAALIASPLGGCHDNGRALRQGLDRVAGAGANDPEPVGRH